MATNDQTNQEAIGKALTAEDALSTDASLGINTSRLTNTDPDSRPGTGTGPTREDQVSVAIRRPAANSTLYEPARGESVLVILSISQIGDVNITEVSVSVTYPGIPNSFTTDAVGGPHDQTWDAQVTFDHSGPARLSAIVYWTHIGTGEQAQTETTGGLAVTVAPSVLGMPDVKINRGTVLELLEDGKNNVTGGNGFPVEIVTNNQIASITVQCLVDGQDLAPVSIPHLRINADSFKWYDGSAIVLNGTMAPRPFSGLPQPRLRVTYQDYFGVGSSFEYPFETADVTGPSITISQPTEDQQFPTPSLPYTVHVSGTVKDIQSGYKDGSLQYFCSGTGGSVPVASDGTWAFDFVATSYGQYTLRMDARDNVLSNGGNLTTPQAIRQFEVPPTVKPQNIEELLSSRAYLGELTRFISSHLVTADGSTSVGPSLLKEKFFQDFGALQFDAAFATQTVNDLLTPVQILRQVQSLETAGLIARYSFDEQQADGATLKERGGRFGLDGRYIGGPPVVANPALAGAIVIDLDRHAIVDGKTHLLEVGKDNSDFSVSFWIYLQGRPTTGEWPALLFKGDPAEADGVIRNRTFALWLLPNNNKIHFRIATDRDPNAGGNSNTELTFNRWTHLAYIKAGQCLRLYIDGRIDAEVLLLGNCVANAHPLQIGRSPNNNGFTGAFDELRIYAFGLSPGDVAQLALDRRSALAEAPVSAYHRVAYESLLSGLGTSFEEIRGINLLTLTQREALARRLGLWTGQSWVGDLLPARRDALARPLGTWTGHHGAGDLFLPALILSLLSALIPPDTTPPPGETGYELWLAQQFGLPMTINGPSSLMSTPGVLAIRQQALTSKWASEDSGRFAPNLDPDLVEIADLSSKSDAWMGLLRQREAELAVQFRSFATTLSASEAIASVFPDEEAQLLEIATRDGRGEDISGAVGERRLDRPQFVRLIAYLNLLATPTELSSHEREDLAHLLVQVWKVRVKYPEWLTEESRMAPQKLWPSRNSNGIATTAAWVSGHFRSVFLPWRGNQQARSDLEMRLNSRLSAWQALIDSHNQAVANAQRVALPLLRDGLLGLSDLPDAPQRMDKLAERWLMDFSTTGATQWSPIDQATASLQTLVNGVRGGWFDVGHPANGWKVQPDRFEQQWGWLDSYGRWQAAVLNYLYPENVLFPELKDIPQGSDLDKLLTDLGKLQPLSTTSKDFIDIRSKVPIDTATDDFYFGHVAIGLALQRAGLYLAALDEYRKVYDPSRKVARKIATKLQVERDDSAPIANFGDANWTTSLSSPHDIAGRSGCQNPYTRFTLFQILRCLLAQADDAFAAGTRDGRTRAFGIYLEANDILGFDELRDLQPAVPQQAYLPSPVLASLRAHTASALSKLRRGLSYLGTPMPPDLTRGPSGGAVSSLMRPTPYRYRVLMERAKQLVAQSQQLEAQYLSALERGDSETEKLLTSGFAVDNAQQTVSLRSLQETEASDGKELAIRQQARSQIQKDRYRDWIAAGPNENERTQIDNIWENKTARDAIAGLDASIAVGQRMQEMSSSFKVALWWQWVMEGAVDAQIGIRALVQGFSNYHEARSQVSGILASQERRTQEWQLQKDLAELDIKIGDAQITLAQDRIDIATQESLMASTQLSQAKQMLAFLSDKFSSERFYKWFSGELGQIYATFLRLATVTAQHAELQLAFERQEQPARLIKSDYWQLASQSAAAFSSSTGTNPGNTRLDSRGITGSARLLQDIYALDEQAFSSERRLLNLTQSFSVARQMPIEFEAFRRTGVLTIATPMSWFDEGFPGHYLRLVKRVRVAVAALIPPSVGIRATLANSGMSRVVTADAGYPTVVIQQPPQLVALTSAAGSSGVFELDTQSELLYPFEGSGVDTTWFLDLPPAGNPFDFDSLMDVVLMIDYTALHSAEVRDRVIKQLPRLSMGDRTFSIKRDLPDVWYELTNSSSTTVAVAVTISKRSFPPGLSGLAITASSISIRSTDGAPSDFAASLRVLGANNTPTLYPSIGGIVSSRQSGVRWLDTSWPIPETPTDWIFSLSDVSGAGATAVQSFLTQLRNGEIDDILLVTTFSGLRPPW